MASRLMMSGVRKAFGPTVALDGVDFSAEEGEVHALIGENGAGKSTLMKVLAGVHAPDAGRMELDGEEYRPANPLDARRRGVAMIFQELALAPQLTVGENILLGIEPASRGWLRHGEAASRAADALKTLGHADISPETLVNRLSVGAQQLVEIARALVTEARIVVLDEPTSSLSRPDAERLFEVVRTLTARGVSVVYISHFLEEVETIADNFTVLRDGRSVGGGVIGEVPLTRIVEWMVGRQLDEMFPRVPHQIGEAALSLAEVAAPGVSSASLILRRGEILGISGLIGAGRTELLRAIFGLAPVLSGEVRVEAFRGAASPRERLAQGVGFLSEDRKSEGLAAGLAVEDNITLSRLEPFVKAGWLSRRAMTESASRWIGEMGVKAAGPRAKVTTLSGGNQQKVQLARLLHHDCDILLLDEPTRGIDVASKAQIYEWIGKLAAAGKAILLVSSYIPELMGVCDTIAVMHRGRLGEARAVSEWSERSIMLAATGVGEMGGARAGL